MHVGVNRVSGLETCSIVCVSCTIPMHIIIICTPVYRQNSSHSAWNQLPEEQVHYPGVKSLERHLHLFISSYMHVIIWYTNHSCYLQFKSIIIDYHSFQFLPLQQWHYCCYWWYQCQVQLLAQMLDDVPICHLPLCRIYMFSSLSLFVLCDLVFVYSLLIFDFVPICERI